MDKALDYVRQLIVEGITQYGRDLKAYAVDKDRLEKATHPSSTAWSLLELATVEDLDYIGRGLQILHKNEYVDMASRQKAKSLTRNKQHLQRRQETLFC